MRVPQQRLIDTFPPVVVAADAVKGTPPESFDYANQMGGNDWLGVSEDVYETYTDALILMAPTTLRHFIAGYLSVASEVTNSLSAESLMYAAMQGDHLEKLCKLLSRNQVACLFDVLEYVYLDNYGDRDDSEFAQIKARRSRLLAAQQDAL